MTTPTFWAFPYKGITIQGRVEGNRETVCVLSRTYFNHVTEVKSVHAAKCLITRRLRRMK